MNCSLMVYQSLGNQVCIDVATPRTCVYRRGRSGRIVRISRRRIDEWVEQQKKEVK